MYRIGEFSKITSLTVKALHYYDDIGLLKPANTDSVTGYRYYDQANYQSAMVIKSLKRFDFSIQELLEAVPRIEGPDDLAAYLDNKKDQIKLQVETLRKTQKQIALEVSKLKEVTKMSQTTAIIIKDIPAVTVASIRFKGRYDSVGNVMGPLFRAVGGNAVGAPFSLYYDEAYTEEDADIEICVAVKKPINKDTVTSRTLPAQKVVSAIHYGPYETLHETYKAIADYMNANNLKGIIPSREHYLKGPGMLLKGNPEKYQTEIQIPID